MKNKAPSYRFGSSA